MDDSDGTLHPAKPLWRQLLFGGRCIGSQMSGDGYQAVVDGLLARRGLVYSRLQVKNQLVVLKNTHSFWRYLQVHTGLGRNPDGTVDAKSVFWKTHTEVTESWPHQIQLKRGFKGVK
jgi:hypothetical protein